MQSKKNKAPNSRNILRLLLFLFFRAHQRFSALYVSALLCFPLPKEQSAFWPRAIPVQSTAMAMERRLAGLSRSAGCFFIFQTSATSFSTDCNFLLVSLISSPNALAANSDPVCSFFFSHINTSSAVTTNLCRPSCPAPLSFLSPACLST